MGLLACGLTCAAAENAWIEVHSSNFVVISDASADQARRTAGKFEQFRTVIQTALPKLRVDPGTPLMVYAARDANSLKALLPKELQQKGMRQPAGNPGGTTFSPVPSWRESSCWWNISLSPTRSSPA
jgi:hypothetical protein